MRVGLVVLAMSLASNAAWGGEQFCSYTTYQWNVNTRKSVGHRKVVKPYGELTEAERDVRSGCTVCEEDQVTLAFPGLRPFKVCKSVAPHVREIIDILQRRQAPLLEVTGYRVGMTRGDVDAAGNRTGFSNHSFGVALDINTSHNGLYENCVEFNSSCRLIKGGNWVPDDPLSLIRGSIIVEEFKRNGFLWGGEIAGQQKDFMHFSLTGY
ncbi:MAG: M15 family metallopeptidase [Gammaproteobacteria bacterium]|nr:M15 family metallopeptidase [Gammaproteobacteria bacterium]MBU1777061.1 M15 family metallopeptidase [Gammaproteobacteria bacterium]MBU1969146.1 M15 family metallopeptidase [Gammaproteobacteria bacterium]